MTPTDYTPPGSMRRRAPALGMLLFGLSACSGAEIMSPAGPSNRSGDACPTNQELFAQRAWPEVFGKTCVACHGPGGIASEGGAGFKLLPSSYPGFVDANLAEVAEMAKNEYADVPLLLAKPMGLAEHGGGKLVEEGDATHTLLTELIERVLQGDPCAGEGSQVDLSSVELLTPYQTFRKASLQLAGRLPSEAEVQRLDAEGEASLAPLLDALMHEEAFYGRLKEMFNDIFLTDRYYPREEAVDLLHREQYPLRDLWFALQPEDTRRAVNRAIAREPLELIAYIVKHDRPFTEVVTADYTVVNPFSAIFYSADVRFDDPEDENDFKPARIELHLDGTKVPMPHAGVLTNPMWLNRFPTTETNRNRHRARMVMQQFLATDILNVAERPIDPKSANQYNNPTRDDPSCASCHRQLDPIAGAFMKWDDDDQEEYLPEREWYREMFAPGYADELMPVAEFTSAQSWLGQRIVNDPRFALSVVRNVYTALTGHAPIAYPRDQSEGYAAQLAAWETQDAAFRALTDELVTSDYDLRVAVRGVVLSPYFRAVNTVDGLLAEGDPLFTDLGTGRLSIPEVLDRKITAVLGFPWRRDPTRAPYLRSDYQILYGGIDSEDVTSRLTDVNSVMSGVQWRMANEMSCVAVPFDFTQAKAERLLFKHVELETTPLAEDGTEDAAAIESIKKNLQHLMERMWGERVALDSPELDVAYGLFLDTFREGIQGVASDTLSDRLPCALRTNPKTGAELPEAQRLERDPRYTVRAWMAVLTYLMADYQFLYE